MFYDFLSILDQNSISSNLYIGVTKAIPEVSLVNELDNKGQRRMDINFKTGKEDFKVKYSIWFKDEPGKSRTGKVRYLDNRGNASIWVSDLEGIQDINFNKQKARVAKVGEVEFNNFMKAWTSYSNKFKVDFPAFSINKIVEGDLSELEPFFSRLKETEIVICVGVKDERYQDVLPFFLPAWTFPSGNDENSKQQVKNALDRFEKQISKVTTNSIFASVPLMKYEEYSKDRKTPIVDSYEDIPF